MPRKKTTTKRRAKRRREYWHKQFHVLNADVFSSDVALAVNMTEHEVLSALVKFVNKNTYKNRPREEAFFKEVQEQLAGWDACHSDGRCIVTPWGCVALVRFSKNRFRRCMSILVHELLHAAHYILRHRRIPLIEDTEEVYTYLTDHLVEVAMGRLWD
jgi:ribosomal protein L32